MILFTLQFHSVLDVITNSSSELFVGIHKSKELMTELVKNIHPRYLDEYDEIKKIDELTEDELYEFISYHFNGWSNRKQQMKYSVVNGFTFEQMYEDKVYGNRSYTEIRDDFIKKNRDGICNGIDHERKMFFMFSNDENPNWDMQEGLMSIMTRYHLG